MVLRLRNPGLRKSGKYFKWVNKEVNKRGREQFLMGISQNQSKLVWASYGIVVWMWNVSCKLPCLSPLTSAGFVVGEGCRAFRRWSLAGGSVALAVGPEVFLSGTYSCFLLLDVMWPANFSLLPCVVPAWKNTSTQSLCPNDCKKVTNTHGSPKQSSNRHQACRCRNMVL